jgi:hypothetical protein
VLFDDRTLREIFGFNRYMRGYVGVRLLIGVLILSCCVRLPAASPAPGSVAEQYLFAAANAERAQRGLPQLHWDGALYQAALGHAREMASRASISHQYPGEPELAQRGKIAGAHFSVIAENVAEAPTAVRIHDAWMNSPGHRENLLDPRVDSIGISVIRRDGQLYAVQDFDRSVVRLSLREQESEVGRLVSSTADVALASATEEDRQTCSMESGYAGERQPWYLMRFTAGELDRLPAALKARLETGKYRHATVAACSPVNDQPFTSFHIAVLLYP